MQILLVCIIILDYEGLSVLNVESRRRIPAAMIKVHMYGIGGRRLGSV